MGRYAATRRHAVAHPPTPRTSFRTHAFLGSQELFMSIRVPALAVIFVIVACLARVPLLADEGIEGKYLSNMRQVTSGFVKAGEGYFSPDGNTIIYQAVPQDYPFYQIYTQALGGGEPQRISTGAAARRAAIFRPTASESDLRLQPSRPATLDKTEDDERKQQAEDAKSGRAPTLSMGLRSLHGHLRSRFGRQDPAASDRRQGLRRRRSLFARWQADRLLQRPRRRPRHLT